MSKKSWTLQWEVTHRYSRSISTEMLTEMATALHCEATPQAVGDALEARDWRATDLLAEMAGDPYWVDMTDAELFALDEETL